MGSKYKVYTYARIINKVKQMQDAGMDVDVDHAYGQFKITNRTGNLELSRRGTNVEIWWCLETYRCGWEAARWRYHGTATDRGRSKADRTTGPTTV